MLSEEICYVIDHDEIGLCYLSRKNVDKFCLVDKECDINTCPEYVMYKSVSIANKRKSHRFNKFVEKNSIAFSFSFH